MDMDFDFSESTVNDVEMTQAEVQLREVRKLLKLDGEFFIEFFLGEELTTPVPGIHTEIWGLLTNTAMQRVLLAIPRDHAKTTLAKLAVVWYFLFTNHRFCVYLSNTNTIAKNACKDVMGFLQSPNCRAVFGDIKILKESETDSLWIFELMMPDGRIKKCILRAVGANQQMRGINIDNQRPDIAVVDDVEDNENTDSEHLQKKLDRWIFGPFIKALARQKKIIWLGNMLKKTSLLARLSANPKWNPVVFGSIIKDSVTGELKPLWPERWPLDELIEDFMEYRSLGLVETWMCEMMNMPGHGKNGFRPDQANYQPLPDPQGIRGAFITLDPAFGEGAQNDNTAIVVHVIPNDGVPMVAEYVNQQMREHEMFQTMCRFALKWNAWVWGIEAVAAQKVLITLFSMMAAGQQIHHLIEMVPLVAGRGDPKVARISAFVSAMESKDYAIPESDLEIVTQMVAYDMTKKSNKDDLLDSCAYGPQMIEQFMHLILSHYNGGNLEEESEPRSMADV